VNKFFSNWVSILVGIAILVSFIVASTVKIQKVEDKTIHNEQHITSFEIRVEKKIDKIQETLLDMSNNGRY